MKSFGRVGLHGGDLMWPARRRADFHSWLFGLKRGLQPLGLSLRPHREEYAPHADDLEVYASTAGPGWREGEIEPMPVVF